jgi:protein tyrosine phosphatase
MPPSVVTMTNLLNVFPLCEQDDTDAHAAGPAIVHCSAGIGRTGTFCAVDIELRRLRAMHPSDITSAPQIIEAYIFRLSFISVCPSSFAVEFDIVMQ